MGNRRTFLYRAAGAVASIAGAAVIGLTSQAKAADRKWYVWYRRESGGRYNGVGPYTYQEALEVEKGYIKAGCKTYIGGVNG